MTNVPYTDQHLRVYGECSAFVASLGKRGKYKSIDDNSVDAYVNVSRGPSSFYLLAYLPIYSAFFLGKRVGNAFHICPVVRNFN